MCNSHEWGKIVVLPTRRKLSWKKPDPPYGLVDVLANSVSDQLSCWLHQRVQRERQINYRNEANLLFLSRRAAVCFPLTCFPFSLSTVPECFLLDTYSLLLLINPYKLAQEKDLFMREEKSGAFIEWKCHRNGCRLAEEERDSVLPPNLFHSFETLPLKVD